MSVVSHSVSIGGVQDPHVTSGGGAAGASTRTRAKTKRRRRRRARGAALVDTASVKVSDIMETAAQRSVSCPDVRYCDVKSLDVKSLDVIKSHQCPVLSVSCSSVSSSNSSSRGSGSDHVETMVADEELPIGPAPARPQ